jgi:hypothetical protein
LAILLLLDWKSPRGLHIIMGVFVNDVEKVISTSNASCRESTVQSTQTFLIKLSIHNINGCLVHVLGMFVQEVFINKG